VLKPEHQERRNKMSTADLCILWKRPKIYKDIIYYATLATVLKSKNGRFTSPVKRHLRPPNPQLTPPTRQIQYCYSLIMHVLYNDKQITPLLIHF
jgi:hypothetical protein